jgi:hypothetical protein
MAVFAVGGGLVSALPALREVPELMIVGPWTPAPPGLVAFDAAAALAEPESLWRVELARDAHARRSALDGGERSVVRGHALLDGLPERLDRAIAELAQARDGSPRAISAVALSPPDDGSANGLERTLHGIADLVRGRARIETAIEGAMVARSIVRLSGGTELWVAPGLAAPDADAHARSVAVALRTRHCWARIVALIVRSVRRLALLGLPTGPASLWIVWCVVRDALRELRTLTAGAYR